MRVVNLFLRFLVKKFGHNAFLKRALHKDLISMEKSTHDTVFG